jgi:hypothetical protein
VRNAYDWAIAVFVANEERHLGRCLASLVAAGSGRASHLTVILNGTTDRSLYCILEPILRRVDCRIYYLRTADKARAINEYIHCLRPPAGTYFMADAYIEVRPDALDQLHRALAADAHAHVASAVPLNGRSAPAYRAALLKGGGINGNLYALRGAVVERLAAAGYRLPRGLYRTDPLLGSMLAHDLDPLANRWDAGRLIAAPGAGYRITPLSPFRPRDVLRQYRREVNQTRGVIETAALRACIYRHGYGALPEDAAAMLRQWLAANPLPRMSLRRRLFLRPALRRLAAPGPVASEAAALPDAPELLVERPAGRVV